MRSIRGQLTRNLLGAFFVLLGGALAALYFTARDELIEQFDDALRAKALAISSLAFWRDNAVRLDTGDQFFRSFNKEERRDFFEIWGEDGQPLRRSDSLWGSDLPSAEKPGAKPRIWDLKLPNGKPGRVLVVKFSPDQLGGDRRDRPARVDLNLAVASESEPLEEALAELLGVGAACGVVLYGATIWLVTRVLKRGLLPLGHLGEQAARINAESLTTRFPTENLPAELLPIAGRLNELLARLEVSFERERRFSADVAHELRTPLAELRSMAECSLKWPESRDPAADQETLAIAAQMQAMVASLLALVRGEQEQIGSQRAPVDLAALAREVWRPLESRAAERGLKINWVALPTTVQADEALLRSILNNLFENAVEYAPAGEVVDIRLENDATSVKLRIRNSTENLSREDVPKMFDRFWRKEEARTGGKHFGLGLSLAQMFARAMDWTLTAALDEQRRLEFTLAGPVTPAKP